MNKFRKKQVIIEAVQLLEDNAEEVAKWCSGVLDWNIKGEPLIEIETLEGTMTAVFGDFVIKGIADEFYPCAPEIFEESYEEARGCIVKYCFVEEKGDTITTRRTMEGDAATDSELEVAGAFFNMLEKLVFSKHKKSK